jgi:hypothetical protein
MVLIYMETYGRLLGQMYDRLMGGGPDTRTMDVSLDTARAILDNTAATTAFNLRSTLAPATTNYLTGDEPVDGWDSLAAAYDLRDAELRSRDDGTTTEYEIQVDYYVRDLYRGQWLFTDIDEATVWATMNDV